MEVAGAFKSNNELKHRPLTPLRLLRGVVCIVVFLSTASMLLLYLGPAAAVILRFISLHHSRKVTAFFLGSWLAMWPFLFENINKTKVVFSGDTVPARERVLLIANHRTEVDWMYLWDLALRKGRLGYIKYMLKSSLMKLPVFGWAFHILEFISVARDWNVDEQILKQTLSTFTNPQDPLWLAVFPEGTDFTEQKCKNCKKYAMEVGLPVLENVLLPKTKGFYTCLEILRSSLDAVYDVTIGYKHQCPLFLDNVFGVDPSEVHINVRRVPVSDIPLSEDEVSTWLMEAFQRKDSLLSNFKDEGHFPDEAIEPELSAVKGWVNFIAVMLMTAVFAYLTLFSSVWFKVYIGLACAYLASATHLRFQPTPILAPAKAVIHCNKTR